MKCLFDTCKEAIEYATETKSFGVFYSEHSKPSLQMHVHECCEIFFSLTDGNTFLIDGKVYDVKANDLFILNQFEAHKVSPALKKNFIRYSLHVHPTFLYANSTQALTNPKGYGIIKPRVEKESCFECGRCFYSARK